MNNTTRLRDGRAYLHFFLKQYRPYARPFLGLAMKEMGKDHETPSFFWFSTKKRFCPHGQSGQDGMRNMFVVYFGNKKCPRYKLKHLIHSEKGSIVQGAKMPVKKKERS